MCLVPDSLQLGSPFKVNPGPAPSCSIIQPTVISEYVAHYHEGLNHQGLGNELIDPAVDSQPASGPVRCRTRLGG